LNFSPSTKKATEYPFELFLSIYRLRYFSQVLNFTSVELTCFAKQAKLFKNLFSKSDGGHAISCQEKRWLLKSTTQFPINIIATTSRIGKTIL